MSGHVPSILRRRKTWLLAAGVAAVVALPTAVGAAETTVRACVKTQGGAMRIVSGTTACGAGEFLVVWNKTGVTGPRGATGATGPAGATGQNGQNGQNGGNGKDGAPGAPGTPGVPGPAGPAGASAERTPLGQSAFMRCTGIDGGATTPGFGKSIEVLSYSHGVVSPRDAASGLPTGKRQHKPFTITKELDKSTPLLYQRLIGNSTIPFCVVSYVHKFADGSLEPYMTITLTNAQVAGVESKKGDVRSLDQRHYGEYEEVSFTYQKITWEALDGGITAQDDWEAPVS
jgi:type VI secretion system secreted protein Hcp